MSQKLSNNQKQSAQKKSGAELSRKTSVELPANDGEVQTARIHGNQSFKVFRKCNGTSDCILQVSQPNDKEEIEADKVADNVLSNANPAESPPNKNIGNAAPGIKRKCTECEEEKQLYRKPTDSNTNANRRYNNSGLNISKEVGSPLSSANRRYFEPRFKHDLSHVRVHTSAAAHRDAVNVSAKAFTIGNHIGFQSQHYSPESFEGKRLLAHEITHTLQAQNDGIYRTRCGHDGRDTKCGFAMGAASFEPTDPTGEVLTGGDAEPVTLSADQMIVSGMAREFQGTWARQVSTPPNRLKTGRDSGYADGVKVNDNGSSLEVEVVEVKARSSLGGGCRLATQEAEVYRDDINSIAPHVVAMSQAFAQHGGFRIHGGHVPRNNAQRAALTNAGVDLDDDDSRNAWRFYNSLQNRLNRTYIGGFTSVNAALNGDGTAGQEYLATAFFITCTRRNGGGTGLRKLNFMVNQRGGVSYGCKDNCRDRDRDEDRDQVRPEATDEDQTRLHQQPQPGVSEDQRDEDIGEDQPPVELPPEGMPTAEILVGTGTALSIIYALNRVARNRAERRLARETAEQVIEQLARTNPRVASQLDSANIRRLGTEAYDDVLRAAEHNVDDMARQVPRSSLTRRLGSRGAQAVMRNGARFFIVVGVVMTAADAYALADNYSKGAEIEFGLLTPEADLDGDTRVEVETHGREMEGAAVEANLEDTVVELDVTSVPTLEVDGSIEAERAQIRGNTSLPDGAPISMQFNVQLRDTTITITHQGVIEGNNIQLGESSISNSEIEINLPPGTVQRFRASDDNQVTIENVRMTITQPGQPGASGTPGSGDTASGTAESGSDESAAESELAADTPSQSGSDTTNASGGEPASDRQAIEGSPTTPVSPNASRAELLQQVFANPLLRRVFETFTQRGGEGALPETDFLNRLIQLEPLLQANENQLDTILSNITPGAVTQPIQQLIEPLERDLTSRTLATERALENAIGIPADSESESEAGVTAASRATSEVRIVQYTQLQSLLALPNVTIEDPERFTNPQEVESLTYIWNVSPQLSYRIPANARFIRTISIENPPPDMHWAAEYELTISSEVVNSNQGNFPIRIVNARSNRVRLQRTGPTNGQE